MTSWPTERAAIENMIENFGSGVYSIVMDSYDYAKALSEVRACWAAGEEGGSRAGFVEGGGALVYPSWG